MTTQSLKLSIHELVNQTDDEDFLNGIFLLLKRFVADDFVGFEADGSAISDEAFVHSILEADADIEAGNGISHEAMKAKYGL